MATSVVSSFEDPPMPVLIAEGKPSSISEKLLNGSYNDYNISSDDIMMPELIAEGSKPSKRKRKRKLSFTADIKKKKNPHTLNSSLPSDHSFSAEVKSNKRQRLNPGPVEVYFLPLKEGWVREVVSRKISDVSKNDIYYHPPHGKKLRSRVEIGKFLGAEGIKHLTVENFTFFSGALGYGEPFEVCRGAQLRIAAVKKEKKDDENTKKGIKSSTSVKIQEKKQKGDSPKKGITATLPVVMYAIKKLNVASKPDHASSQLPKVFPQTLGVAIPDHKKYNKKIKPRKLFVKPKEVEESSDEEHQVITEIAEDAFVEYRVEEENPDKIIGLQIQQEFDNFRNQSEMSVSRATGGEVNHSLSPLHSGHGSTTQNGSHPERLSFGQGNYNSGSLVKESRDHLSHIHNARESSLQEANSLITGDQAYRKDTPRDMSEERRNGESSLKPVEFYDTNTTVNDKECKSTNTTTDRVTDSSDCLNVRKKKKRLKKKEKDSDILFVETGIVRNIKQEKEEGNDFFPVISSVKSGLEAEMELDDSLQIPLNLWYDAPDESKKREKQSEVQILPQVKRSVSDRVYTNQEKSYSAVANLTHNLPDIKICKSPNKTKIKDVLPPQAPKPVTNTNSSISIIPNSPIPIIPNAPIPIIPNAPIPIFPNSPIAIIPPHLPGVQILMSERNSTMSNNNKRQLVQAGKNNVPTREHSSLLANQAKYTYHIVFPSSVSQKKKASTDASHNPTSSSSCSTKTSGVQFSAANQIPTTADNKVFVSVPDQLPLVLALSSL